MSSLLLSFSFVAYFAACRHQPFSNTKNYSLSFLLSYFYWTTQRILFQLFSFHCRRLHFHTTTSTRLLFSLFQLTNWLKYTLSNMPQGTKRLKFHDKDKYYKRKHTRKIHECLLFFNPLLNRSFYFFIFYSCQGTRLS